jgi:uncharacterized protein (TIGR02246 family)
MRMTLLVSSLVLLAACQPVETAKPAEAAAPPPAPVLLTEAEALAIADKPPATLIAGDLPGVVALYTDDAVLVDVGLNKLITDKKTNETVTGEFMKMGPSKFAINEQKVQVLDADTFIVTIVATGTLKNGPPAGMIYRVTDVFQKQGDGSWKIANEHLSMAPEAVKTPLPVIRSIPPS